MTNTHRQFIRHTVNVPLEVKVLPDAPARAKQAMNVSEGGLAFKAADCIPLDSIIELRITSVQPAFEAKARVAWCKEEAGQFLVGVQFLNENDAFQSRMVQQVCAIENYRQEQLQKGRMLNNQQAASEWIAKFAGRFPDGASE